MTVVENSFYAYMMFTVSAYRVSMRKRLIGSMVLMIVMFVLTLVFTKLDVSSCEYPSLCSFAVMPIIMW